MRVKHKKQGKIVDKDTRTVEEFQFSPESLPKCAWCGKPYRNQSLQIESLGGFTCIDGCGQVTSRSEFLMQNPNRKKITRVWAGKEYKWETINEIQEALQECKSIVEVKSVIIPKEVIEVSIKQVVVSEEVLSQPDLI